MSIFNILKQNFNSKIGKFVKLVNRNSKLPERAEYRGSYDNPWSEIPLGIVQENGKNVEFSIDLRVNPHTLITGYAGSGKSVLQRNLIRHCLQRPDDWRFLGIDLKRVELSPYESYDPVVMGIATDVPDSVEVLRYAKEEMDARYKEMEAKGVNHFKDLPTQMHALMVMIDESYMFLAPSGIKTDEGVEEDALKSEASKLIAEIARLGRAAGIHLVLATQRLDVSVFGEKLLMDFGNRIMVGQAGSETLKAAFGDESVHIDSLIRGRGYIRTNQGGKEFQAYYTPIDLDLPLTGKPDAEV